MCIRDSLIGCLIPLRRLQSRGSPRSHSQRTVLRRPNGPEGPPLVVGGGPVLRLALLPGLPLDLDLEDVDTDAAVTAPDMVESTDGRALALIVLGTITHCPPPLAGSGGERQRHGRDRPPAAAPEPPQTCLLYTSPSPRDLSTSRMPSSA